MTTQSWSEEEAPARPRQPTASFAVSSIVIMLALVAVLHSDAKAFQTAWGGAKLLVRSNDTSWARKEINRYEAIRRELARQVPPGTRAFPATEPGATVYWRSMTPYTESEVWRMLWSQRLAEFEAMAGVVVVDDVSKAQVRVSVVEDPATPNGIRLVVERLR